MKAFCIALVALAGCGSRQSGNQYGFVTTLGRDTLSVERAVRRGDTVTMESVDRFPRVRIRHTEVVLAPDRSIRRMVMDIRTPSAPLAKDRDRHVTAEFGQDSLKVSVRDSSGTETRTFASEGGLVLPHVQQMYSLAELYIDAAVARGRALKIAPGDSVTVTQFYPDAPLDNFIFHDGWVQPHRGDSVEIWHGMISGVGFAMVDSSGRLMRYDGSQSTYKVDVRRLTTLPDVEGMSARMTAAERKSGAVQLSVRDTTRAIVGAATFMVDYGRPLARGRRLLFDVIEKDQVWRTGANAATQFSTSAPITLAGLALAPGMYTLWSAPHEHGVDLIVSKQTGQWGTDYDPSHDLGSAPLIVATAADTVEKFTISIAQTDAKHGALLLAWGTFRWTAPIVLR